MKMIKVKKLIEVLEKLIEEYGDNLEISEVHVKRQFMGKKAFIDTIIKMPEKRSNEQAVRNMLIYSRRIETTIDED